MSAAVERARALIARPGAWLAAGGDAYQLRMGPDRRSRVILTLDEAQFRDLVRRPGLRRREAGGWEARRTGPAAPGPVAATIGPGIVPGRRQIVEPDGRVTFRAANLGESPVAWLARRRAPDGRPYLSAAEAAAGERLRLEWEAAQAGPSLTMRWDALPRSGAGTSARVEPGDRAMAAGRRLAQALDAVPPAARAMVEAICLNGSSLQLAERALGLRQRQGRYLLQAGLSALAAYWRIG